MGSLYYENDISITIYINTVYIYIHTYVVYSIHLKFYEYLYINDCKPYPGASTGWEYEISNIFPPSQTPWSAPLPDRGESSDGQPHTIPVEESNMLDWGLDQK